MSGILGTVVSVDGITEDGLTIATVELPARVMPAQKPGRSRQDYATPPEFLDAVRKAFGPIVWDLAAHRGNRVCDAYFGPDHAHEPSRDSLQCDWADIRRGYSRTGLLWLNPPFGSIAPWAAKCAAECARGAEILFLVPASVGANWFWDHVAPHAYVYALSPRLSFDGKNSFPKDLILAHYQPGVSCGYGFSRWKWNA